VPNTCYNGQSTGPLSLSGQALCWQDVVARRKSEVAPGLSWHFCGRSGRATVDGGGPSRPPTKQTTKMETDLRVSVSNLDEVSLLDAYASSQVYEEEDEIGPQTEDVCEHPSVCGYGNKRLHYLVVW
jgi:hypothetical protein